MIPAGERRTPAAGRFTASCARRRTSSVPCANTFEPMLFEAKRLCPADGQTPGDGNSCPPFENTPVMRSAGALASDDRARRCEQNSDIGPQAACPRISQIQPDHFVECGAAPPLHLPESGHAGFCLEHTSPVPRSILFEFVLERRPRPHQGHLAAEYIPQLRKFVEAGLPQDVADSRNPRVFRDFEKAVSFAFRLPA